MPATITQKNSKSLVHPKISSKIANAGPGKMNGFRAPRIGNQKGKKRRHKPGDAAIKEIKMLQKRTTLELRKKHFQGIVRATCNCNSMNNLETFPSGVKWQKEAVQVFQEAFEAELIQVIEFAVINCLHAKRVTTNPKDTQLASYYVRELAKP